MEICMSLTLNKLSNCQFHSKSNFSGRGLMTLQTCRFHDMRYFWGFVQLQDMVDNAIIEMKTDMVSKYKD